MYEKILFIWVSDRVFCCDRMLMMSQVDSTELKLSTNVTN